MSDKQEHECPYGGWTVISPEYKETDCGESGFLCHRCREDRADARFARLQRALSLALSGWKFTPDDATVSEEKKDATRVRGNFVRADDS